MTPTNEVALSRNTAPGPAAATIRPPRAGPAERAMLNPTPPSAAAAGTFNANNNWFGMEYKHYPVIYTVKIALTAVAIWFVLPGYRQFPFRISWLAIVVGVVIPQDGRGRTNEERPDQRQLAGGGVRQRDAEVFAFRIIGKSAKRKHGQRLLRLRAFRS